MIAKYGTLKQCGVFTQHIRRIEANNKTDVYQSYEGNQYSESLIYCLGANRRVNVDG
jgi:hypothetical protein